jgi:hypothetical protein
MRLLLQAPVASVDCPIEVWPHLDRISRKGERLIAIYGESPYGE